MTINDKAISNAMSMMLSSNPVKQDKEENIVKEQKTSKEKKPKTAKQKDKQAKKEPVIVNNPSPRNSLSSQGRIKVGFWLSPESNKALNLDKANSGTDKSVILENILREHYDLEPLD